jgi:hypothetical protein
LLTKKSKPSALLLPLQSLPQSCVVFKMKMRNLRKQKCPADRRGAKCFHNGIILIVILVF